MPTTTTKLKLPIPVAADAHAVHTDLLALGNALDIRIAHKGLPYFGKNYIESGGTLSAPGGLFGGVAGGRANINGQTFDFVSPANQALTNTTTNRVWLTATLDVNGYMTGYSFSVRTDAVVPANSVLVGEQVTAGGVVTATTNTFRGIIAPGGLVAETTRTTGTGAVAGGVDVLNHTVMGDGVTPMATDFYSRAFYTTGGATVSFGLELRDAAAGGGTMYQDRSLSNVGGGYLTPADMRTRMGAWVGARPIYARAITAAGNVEVQGFATSPTRLTTRFDF